MKVRLRHVWEDISSGYWFLPSLMTLIAAAAALLVIYFDRQYLSSGEKIAWLYSGGSDGAKTLLATVAGSVITVAGVVFSITIAALTQASAQFGPRLLRNFMRDTPNQVVLGTFVATFLYCLLVLRTIHDKFEKGSAFVPQASVTGAVLLAIASIAVLIYFIHHVSTSLQAQHVIGAVRRELLEDLSRFPEVGSGASLCLTTLIESETPADSLSVTSKNDGYIQAVDYDALVQIATAENVVFRLRFRAGSYIMTGQSLVAVSPSKALSREILASVSASFITADHASAQQDLEYSIRQIVEIGVRALSPGINDPFTAVNCIDTLGSIISRSSCIVLPATELFDADGRLRVVRKVSSFEGLTDVAFNQLRQNGCGSVAVTMRLLEVIGECATLATSESQIKVLQIHLDMVYSQSSACEKVSVERDREEITGRWVSATNQITTARSRLLTSQNWLDDSAGEVSLGPAEKVTRAVLADDKKGLNFPGDKSPSAIR